MSVVRGAPEIGDLPGPRGAQTLYGRSRDVDALLAALPTDGRGGQVHVVSGVPGVGVSTVLDALGRESARRGYGVVTASLSAAEAEVEGSGLRRLVNAAQPFAGRPRHGPEQREELSVQQLAAEFVTLVDRISAWRATVVLLDNAQWLDCASDDVVSRLSVQLAARRVTLFAGRRSPSARLRTVPELSLAPLDDEDAARILEVGAADLSGALRARILADAGGNPRALEELPRCWCSLDGTGADALDCFLPLSRPLVDAFTHGADALSADTAAVLLVAALSRDADLPVCLDAASRLTGRRLSIDVLERAVEHGLVTVVGQRLRFTHPLTRGGVVQRAALSETLGAHAALCAALADRPYDAVWHEAHAVLTVDDDVAQRLCDSAREAERLGMPLDALRRFERSARLTPDRDRQAERFVAAASVAFELGRRDIGEALAATADRIAADPARGSVTACLATRFAAPLRRTPDSVARACELADAHRDAGREDAALHVLVAAAHSAFWSSASRDERAQLVRAFEGLSSERQGAQWAAAISAVDAAAAAPRARALSARPVDDPRDLRLLATVAVNSGDAVGAADLLAQSAGPLRASGRVAPLTHVQGMHARVAATLGDWTQATTLAQECRALAEESDQPLWIAHATATRALVAAMRGDEQIAAVFVEQVDRVTAGRRVNLVVATAQLARGIVLLSKERWAEAYSAIAALFQPRSPAYHPQHHPEAVTFLAECAASAGRVRQTRDVIAAVERTSPAGAVCGAVADALLSGPQDAEGPFAVARASNLAQWPWLEGRLDLAHGVWLRRQHRSVEARDPLRAAGDRFDALGARHWAARAHRELRAAGVGGRTGAGHAERLLSPQELTIARLAADGLSNREIGQQMFLSPRTIGSHLYRVFPKLGVTSRAQLASRLARS